MAFKAQLKVTLIYKFNVITYILRVNKLELHKIADGLIALKRITRALHPKYSKTKNAGLNIK